MPVLYLVFGSSEVGSADSKERDILRWSESSAIELS